MEPENLLSGIGRMEHGGLQCGVPFIRFMEILSMGYRSNGRRRLFSVVYLWNGTGRPSMWDTGRIDREIYIVGYR